VKASKQRILLLGPPASGKGTQADHLSRAFGIPHVSTGALLRSECARGTPLGLEADSWTSRGLLVPDELAVRVITAWMSGNGPRFLFDGFPRTTVQAEHLDMALDAANTPIELVIFLDLSESEIRRRILDRLTCTACGTTFGGSLHGMKIGDACPSCGGDLIRRNDDTEEALSERLRVYRESTLPVVTYYREKNPSIFHRVDAGEGSNEIFQKLSALVSADQGRGMKDLG
jgi:adenylate kinase